MCQQIVIDSHVRPLGFLGMTLGGVTRNDSRMQFTMRVFVGVANRNFVFKRHIICRLGAFFGFRPMGRGTTKWWRGYSVLSVHTNGWNITPSRLRRHSPILGENLPLSLALPALPHTGGEQKTARLGGKNNKTIFIILIRFLEQQKQSFCRRCHV